MYNFKLKFEFLIDRLGVLISQKGKKLVLINVEAGGNPKKQFNKYMEAVELVGDKVECVVSTSLPGEERIFWPFYDVQFYIRDDKEAIKKASPHLNFLSKISKSSSKKILKKS